MLPQQVLTKYRVESPSLLTSDYQDKASKYQTFENWNFSNVRRRIAIPINATCFSITI